MNSWKRWMWACLALGGGVAYAADPPESGPRTSETQPWYAKMLGSSKPKEAEKKDEPETKTPLRPSIIIAPLAPEILAEAVKAEEQACTRRLDVCAKMRQIAIDQNDEPTLRRIDDLERQIIELCQQRVTRLGMRGVSTRSSQPVLPNDTSSSVDPFKVQQPTPANRTAQAESRGVRP